MTFLTRLALQRPSVTVLAVLLVLISGVVTYNRLSVELFPEIEFPLITVIAFYPSANPDAVVSDVTAPIEDSISGISGLEDIQSISTENRSVLLANFKFGTDMAEVENIINSNLSAVRFPAGVDSPTVGRINPDAFPVLQFSLIGDRDISELQQVLESQVLPAVKKVDGVFSVDVTGTLQRRVLVTVDPEALQTRGISLFQVSRALRENNITVPAGAITNNGLTFPVRTTHTFQSIEELRELAIGFPPPGGQQGAPPASPLEPVRLSDVAEVTLGTGLATSISRTNGKPSIGIGVLKDPDANTVDVTTGVLDALDAIIGMPADVEIVTISNDGPEIQEQIDTLQREAAFGFVFAVTVVFLFMMTIRPTAIRGLLSTVRPTVVIGLSIPLSIFTGVLLMGWQGMTLNFMTLGGLAISVGRVVDDSIVVLENVHRHIQGGQERWRAALTATREVGPAITASTLTTIVVFVPLGFIQGLVGSFFLPFAQTVSFALIASLVVALTAVPVLGAYLLRVGDLPEGAGEGDSDELVERETWMQRTYTPILKWALGHKAITLVAAILLTVGSLGLTVFIPVTLFPSGGDRFLSIETTLPPGTSVQETLAAAETVESEIVDVADVYITTVGTSALAFGPGGPGGFNEASMFVRLAEDAPEDTTKTVREKLEAVPGMTITVTEIDAGGPPVSGIELNVTGNNYDDIAETARQLAEELSQLEGVVNVSTDVTEARDEIVINVDPGKAATLGLSSQEVAFQVSQFLVGQTVTQADIDGDTLDVVLTGAAEDVTSVEAIEELMIAGLAGSAPLGEIATVIVQEGPVTIARTDGIRSATINGGITEEDTQAVGIRVQDTIDAFATPPGVEVKSGGVFEQIAEGFQDIFVAMGVGIVLVYLVMVASLGSLRNPFVIVTCLPLALIGALVALAVTGRTLGLPAMMGILLMIGIVVTNAIVLIAFVEQLRERGMSVYDALIQGGRVRLRPILMTAITTSMALLPLAAFVSESGGIIGAELATVVIGGLISSTALTLIVVPVVYTLANESIPGTFHRMTTRLFRRSATTEPASAE